MSIWPWNRQMRMYIPVKSKKNKIKVAEKTKPEKFIFYFKPY